MTLFSLKGKSAIITGGASGIGKAIAIKFASQGAHVHILELNSDAAKQTVEEIKNNNHLATAYSCNVANQKEVFSTTLTT